MKFYSFLKSDILQIKSHWKTSLKFVSTKTVEHEKLNPKLLPMRKKKFSPFSSSFDTQKLLALKDICAVTIAISHVSWARISIPKLSVVNWDIYPVPQTTLDELEESEISILANELKQIIPISELYILENQKKWNSTLNEIQLRAMLIMLLHYNKEGVVTHDKVIIQNKSVLNDAHKLIVGYERKSARPIVSKLLQSINDNNSIYLNKGEYPFWYSGLQIPENLQVFFFNSLPGKQESLSIVLLIALTFINKIRFNGQEKLKIDR